jgi:hypothetical protein
LEDLSTLCQISFGLCIDDSDIIMAKVLGNHLTGINLEVLKERIEMADKCGFREKCLVLSHEDTRVPPFEVAVLETSHIREGV